MDRIYRKGVAIEVAFSSAYRSAAGALEPADDAVLRETTPEVLAAISGIRESKAVTLKARGTVKRFLRALAKLVYRQLKPVFRPLAFRARRYLIGNLQTEISCAVHHSMQELVNEIQASRHALSAEIHHVIAKHSDEARRFEAVASDQLKGSRAELQVGFSKLKQELLNDNHANLERVALKLKDELIEDRRSGQQRSSTEFSYAIKAAAESVMAAQSTAVADQIRASIMPPVGSINRLADEVARLDRIEQYSMIAARRAAVSCGPDELLIRTVVGFVLCDALDHAVVALLLETGDLELGTRLLIERLLRPEEVYVDVGANLGMHILAAGRAMDFRGKIYAFEPFEKTRRALEKTIWVNGLASITEVHQVAVADRPGVKALYLGATSGHHSLFPLDSFSPRPTEHVQVEVVTLDEVLPPQAKVTLLKIDVEGAELEVLAGATNIIKNNPDIGVIAEYGPSHLKRTGHSTLKWLEAFTDLGLEFKAINDQTGALETWALEQIENAESVNLLFARNGSPVWMRALGDRHP